MRSPQQAAGAAIYRKRNKNKDFSWPLKELKSCRSKKEGGPRQREEKLERCHTIG